MRTSRSLSPPSVSRSRSLQPRTLQHGLRSDKNTYSPWLAANLQPRYDATTGKFVKPTAPVTAASPLNTAPYAHWRDFYNYGFDQTAELVSPNCLTNQTPQNSLYESNHRQTHNPRAMVSTKWTLGVINLLNDQPSLVTNGTSF